MAKTIDFICLANSRKHSGRCVAGLRTDGKGWIRPVAAGAEGTLQVAQCVSANLGEVQNLDVVRVELVESKPAQHQPENWVLSPVPWTVIDRPANDSAALILKQHLVSGPRLLGNCSDRTSVETIRERPQEASLALLLTRDVQWEVRIYKERRANRIRFRHGDFTYELGLTDPLWEAKLNQLDPGDYPQEKFIPKETSVLLTASLGEPFKDNHCYKLIAAVIPVPERWRARFS